MRSSPWFERWPALLERQLSALGDAGIPFRIDEELRVRGSLVLEVTPTVKDEVLRFIVAFPSTFPYARFEMHAPGLDLPHHQHPFSKNLCFIGRGTVKWRESDTVADYIRDRLPLVLKAGGSDDPAEVGTLEERQAEPFSDYYGPFYEKDAMILIEGLPPIGPDVSDGRLTIGVSEDAGGVLRGLVLEIRDRAGNVIAEASPALSARFPRTLRARWVRRQAPIREANPEAFHAALVHDHLQLLRPEWQLVHGWKIDVVGVVFPEEVGWRKAGDGWVFLVRGEELKDPGRRKGRKYLARTAQAGRGHLGARVPELAQLGGKIVAVIGLGGLGAPSALELARAGLGELRVLDGDIVDPGTAVRWPFGLAAAGLQKSDVIKSFIRENYPHVRVRAWHRRLGLAGPAQPSDLELLENVLDGASLVYDATAEVGIQHLLADLARERGIPYICVSSTAGAWGGLLIRVRPKETAGCWVCSQWALNDRIIPPPPADPNGGVQPAGCADPTFTGAGFDLGQVALAGVRLAVGTLSGGADAAYPDSDWDVAVISFREHDGQIISPHWATFPLAQHPSCGCTRP
jgi:molybdopterin/thiamine biosynthesis adenylyltransferase